MNMSDSEDSVIADSVDSAATLSPTILRGLESLKSRSSCQAPMPAQHFSTNSKNSGTIQDVEDSQETQLTETRCEGMSSNDQSGSTVFPNTQNTEKMKVDKTKDDLTSETPVAFQISGSSGSKDTEKTSPPEADTKKIMGIISTKLTSKTEGDTNKHLDDFNYASSCLQLDCICKKSSVSLGLLEDVQREVQQLLGNSTISEESHNHMKHLLRSMQQHLRHWTKKQHTHLQNLRELTKQPKTCQPPDLKSQLKKIMTEKQQMLQLLKRHHTLASSLNAATKESSVGTDKQEATDGSHSDMGSLQSASSQMSTSMLAAGADKSFSSANFNYLLMNQKKESSHVSTSMLIGKSVQHASSSSANSPSLPMNQKKETLGNLTNISPKPSTATSIDHTSAPVGNQSKRPSTYFVDFSAKSPQHAQSTALLAHQSTASVTKAQVAFTKNTGNIKSSDASSKSNDSEKEQTSLVGSVKLTTKDIDQIVKEHLSTQQHQTGKTIQPSKIIINIQKPQPAASVSAPLKPQAEQNVQRPAFNIFAAGDKSVENQSSSARFSFPTLANSSVNIPFSASVSNSQSSVPAIAQPMMEKPTSLSQYYTTNAAIPSQFVGSQSHNPAYMPSIRVQTAVKGSSPLVPANTIPPTRNTARFPTTIPLARDAPTATTIPSAFYQFQSSNQFQTRFCVPQRQNTQDKSSSNLTPHQPGHTIQNSEVETANKSEQSLESQQIVQDRVQVFNKPAAFESQLVVQDRGQVCRKPATLESQQIAQDLVQVSKKPATLKQLIDANFLQPGQDVLSFSPSINDQTYRASLDAKGFILDKDRGCFSGPSQWVAAITTKTVASASKIAWKFVHFRGESLASLQQQWAARQISSSSTGAQKIPTVPVVESQTVPEQSTVSKPDLGFMNLASVHLIMTEELYPMTQTDWEDIPGHVYADIDQWEEVSYA